MPLRSQRQGNFWVLNQQRLHSETLTPTSTKVSKYERALELERAAGWCHLAELPAAAVPCCIDGTRRPRGSLIAQHLRCLTSVLLLALLHCLAYSIIQKSVAIWNFKKTDTVLASFSPVKFFFFHFFSSFLFFLRQGLTAWFEAHYVDQAGLEVTEIHLLLLLSFRIRGICQQRSKAWGLRVNKRILFFSLKRNILSDSKVKIYYTTFLQCFLKHIFFSDRKSNLYT